MAKIKSGKDDALEKILGTEKTEKKKFFTKKKIIISAVSVVLVGAIVAGSIIIVSNKKESESEPVYREYTVQRGDILVGLEESSVITLNQENISFPVGAEVIELYVKSGSSVKEGDPLIKMSIDDIEDSLVEYENEISSAESSLEEAKLSRKTELAKAAQDLESNILAGSQAEEKYNQTIQKAEMDLKEAETNASDADENYNNILALSRTFSSDYSKLTGYEDKVDSYQETVDAWQEKKDEADEVSNELKTCESKIKEITDASSCIQAQAMLSEYKADYENMLKKYSDDSDSVKYSELLKSQEKYNNLSDSMSKLQSLFKEKEKLETKVASYDTDTISSKLTSAQKNLSKAKSTYEDFKADFTEKYDKISSQDDMDKSLSDAKTNLEKAKLNLETQKSQYQQTLLTAEHTKTGSIETGNDAQLTYNLKKIQLDEKVKDAEDKLSELKEELDEIKETIGNNGVISAPCDGIVSNISVEEGDEIAVASGEGASFGMSSSTSIMSITDMSEIYVSVSISEDEILDVALDQDVVITLDAFPDETFDGTVDSISISGSTIGAATVTYTVNVKFTQEGHELYDGMSADVNIISGSARDCLYVSKSAITTKDGTSYVYLKGENDEKVETKISTGFTDGQYTQILSGLNEGDIVLAESAIGAGVKNDSKGKSEIDFGDLDPESMSMPSFDMSSFDGKMGGGPQ